MNDNYPSPNHKSELSPDALAIAEAIAKQGRRGPVDTILTSVKGLWLILKVGITGFAAMTAWPYVKGVLPEEWQEFAVANPGDVVRGIAVPVAAFAGYRLISGGWRGFAASNGWTNKNGDLGVCGGAVAKIISGGALFAAGATQAAGWVGLV